MSRILIIAPGADLQKSLQFALEAEGHSVLLRDGFHDPRGIPDDFDCAILDHHAAQGHLALASAFVETASPVILLANTDTHPLAQHSFRFITKPFLGPSLSKAVGEALAKLAPTS
jgi:DNA-binding NtrC family response regulator